MFRVEDFDQNLILVAMLLLIKLSRFEYLVFLTVVKIAGGEKDFWIRRHKQNIALDYEMFINTVNSKIITLFLFEMVPARSSNSPSSLT